MKAIFTADQVEFIKNNYKDATIYLERKFNKFDSQQTA